jgi:tetratricopeptide (TPR) repeat protein
MMFRKYRLFGAVLAALFLLSGCRSMNARPDLRMRPAADVTLRSRAMAHYMAAVLYERQGRMERAMDELDRVIALDEDALTPALRLIRAALRERKMEKALAISTGVMDAHADRANLWIVHGEILHQLKRYDEATQAFLKAIERDPDNMLGYGALVELQENTNDLVAAIDVYRRLLELKPESAALHYQLALALARINDTEGTRKCLERTLELNPAMVRARYLLAVVLFEAEENEACLQHLHGVLTRRPNDFDAIELLAALLVRMEEYNEAVTVYSRILSSGKARPAHHLQAMYLMLRANRPETAEKIAPPVDAPFLGTILTSLARRDRDASHMQLIESLDGVEGDLDEECNNLLNDLLYNFRNEEGGAWLLNNIRTLRAQSDSWTLAIVEARLLMSMDRHQEALDVLDPLLKREKQDKFLHYYLAVCNEECDNFRETEKHLKAYLEIDPDDPDVLNFLGYLYAEKNIKLGEARELLEKALTIRPDNPFYLDSLGWVYFREGDADRAIELIRKSIYRMDGDDAVLRDHLGDALLLKGDTEAAVEEWERAVVLDPSLAGVREKIEKYRKTSE